MTPRERGFLLLSSNLGNPERKPLTTAQLRTLSQRAARMPKPETDRDMEITDLLVLGYDEQMARRIIALLDEEDLLEYYLRRGVRSGCIPITRISEGYPLALRQRLGEESPGVLWAKGDVSILKHPILALVGSRNIHPENHRFAEEVGRQAALQGYALISGNARGSDRIAQDACLAAGGYVISVVADELNKQPAREKVLYLSEEGFDSSFSSLRALSRNRVIHAMGKKTLVAQCGLAKGGTWSGTVQNLRHGWSPVFCFRDGSEAADQLVQLGAVPVGIEDLADWNALQNEKMCLF